MLKPTLAKVVVFLMLAAIVFLPLFLVGDGPAVFLPVAAIFWLDGLVQTMGAPVAVNGGVDAFNLVPPTALGSMLILLGSAVSLATLYVAAAFLVSVFVFARHPDQWRSRAAVMCHRDLVAYKQDPFSLKEKGLM